MKSKKIISVVMIFIILVVGCSKKQSDADVQAINLVGERYLILEDYKEMIGEKELLQIYDDNITPMPGEVYDFKLEEQMAMSYPAQVNAIEATQVDKPDHISITLEKAETLLEFNPENTVLIDVRSEAEFGNGHVRGAINIPLDQITDIETVVPDKNMIVIVYCQSGNRTKQASNQLYDMEYQVVLDAGGINQYEGDLELGN